MRYVADLHVHSRYSRATSSEADLAGYYRWARVKGIGVVGTGDFTHPGWLAELEGQLVEKGGLYALKDAPEGSPIEGAVTSDSPEVRFILTTEISSIYKKRGQVRKVHTLIGVPTLEDARRLGTKLAAIGNIASDGRPILGLDPKDLLSLLMETSPDGFLIPAHIWTPWFSLFGSKSGFDRIEECFEELTPHIFALETGLSSDPLMNWRWSALDRYRLISNSDAHSPAKLGREANLFDTERSWQGLVNALRTGRGFLGTFEFYPEEGKYHFDGHRKCGVCMEPDQTLKTGGMCPVCGTPVTVGVLNRVLTLADRAQPVRPPAAESFRYIIPLPELLAEIAGSGAGSKSVGALYARIITAFGSEYRFLLDAPIEDIARSQGALLAEAVRRMREGRIDPRPGYDGEFGVIRVFDDAELTRLRGQDELFQGEHAAFSRKARGALPAQPARASADSASRYSADSASRYSADSAPQDMVEDTTLLDDEQRAIVECDCRRGLVSAGPGTGKTRLLVGWMVHHVRAGSVEPGRVLALTFTNRAAGELKDRLALLLPGQAGKITAGTFHSFCWSVLRERDPSLLAVYAPSQRAELLETLLPAGEAGRGRALADGMERCWEGMEEPDAHLRNLMDRYEEELRRIGGADLSSLVVRLGSVLQADSAFRAELSARYDLVALDELQDINRPQYELLMQLCSSAGSVLGIGDPDQAIYGFRGSDRELFWRFGEETSARTFHLARNYRSAGAIVAAADALITPARAHGAPRLTAVRSEGSRIRLLKASNPQEEGKLIADAVIDLVGGVDSVSVDAARKRGPRNVTDYHEHGSYAFSEIAVLFRTRAIRDALLPALTGAGLPLTLGAGTPLAEEEPFRSLVAALRLVVAPSDPVSVRILRAHAALTGRNESVDVWLSRRVDLARKGGTEGVCALMDEAFGSLVQRDTSRPEMQLGEEVLRDFAAEHGTDLSGFLSRVSLCARESERARAAQKVALLTFHAAKGLEFPVVFIAGAEEGVTPLPDDLEEERRLFYVAVTRARDILFVSHCARRRVHGKVQEVLPSRFLAEIPAHCRVDKTPRRPPRDRQYTLFG